MHDTADKMAFNPSTSSRLNLLGSESSGSGSDTSPLQLARQDSDDGSVRADSFRRDGSFMTDSHLTTRSPVDVTPDVFFDITTPPPDSLNSMPSFEAPVAPSEPPPKRCERGESVTDLHFQRQAAPNPTNRKQPPILGAQKRAPLPSPPQQEQTTPKVITNIRQTCNQDVLLPMIPETRQQCSQGRRKNSRIVDGRSRPDRDSTLEEMYGKIKRHIAMAVCCPQKTLLMSVAVISLFMSLLAISLVVLILLGALQLDIDHTPMTVAPPTPPTQRACVECNKLTPSPGFPDGVEIVNNASGIFCCVSNMAQLSAYFNAISSRIGGLEKQVDEQRHDPPKELHAYAQQFFTDFAQDQHDEKMFYLTPDKNVDHKSLHHLVHVDEYSLFVDTPGLYQVSAFVQLAHRENSEVCKDNNKTIVKVLVELWVKNNVAFKGPFPSTTSVSCGMTSTLTLGGLVNMTKGAYITTKVNNKELVDPSYSYMSLFLVAANDKI